MSQANVPAPGASGVPGQPAGLGRRICVLTVYGGRLSLWRVALRTLLICLVIPAVVYDSDGRGLHDRIVGSRVFRKN